MTHAPRRCPSDRRRPRLGRTAVPRGFTLIELMAAAALAVVLITALSGILAHLARQHRSAERAAAAFPDTSLLADQLRRDFGHAVELEVGPSRWRLVGPLAEDRATRLPTLRRAEVTYAVANWGGEPWLVRRVVDLSVPGQRPRFDPVWRGAAALAVVSQDALNTLPAAGPHAMAGGAVVAGVLGPRPLGPPPARFEVVVLDAAGRPLLREAILHRPEAP